MPLFSLSVSQYILAIVSASILHKLTVNRFFLGWLTSHKFQAFSIPTNQELKKLKDKASAESRVSKTRNRTKPKRDDRRSQRDIDDDQEVFKIPSWVLNGYNLKKTTVDLRNIESIKYSMDLEWVVDLALMSLFCLLLTEIQFYFYPPTNECNFSILWAFLVVFYCIKILWSLTAIYLKSENSIGERSICLVSGCIFIAISMIILSINGEYLELDLTSGSSLDSSLGLTLTTKLLIILICSCISVLFTFPGLRYGQLHQAIVNDPQSTPLGKAIYSINYISHLLIILLWVKPVSRDLLKRQDFIVLDDATYDTARIYIVLLVNFAKFLLLPKYVAIFLTSTVEDRMRRIRFSGGVTTNRDLQVIISSIYNYFNVIVIQYTLPVLLCFFTTIIYKLILYHKWTSYSELYVRSGASPMLDDRVPESEPGFNAGETDDSTSLSQIIACVLGKFISTKLLASVFGLAVWWLHFSSFCTCSAGVIYHGYFTH